MNEDTHRYSPPMTVLVGGADGPVGRHLTTRLLAEGHRVRVLAGESQAAPPVESLEVVEGDLAHPAALASALSGVEAVHWVDLVPGAAGSAAEGQDLASALRAAGVRRVSVLTEPVAGDAVSALLHASREHRDLEVNRLVVVELMASALGWVEEVRDRDTVTTLATWPTAVVHEADVADVAAATLTRPGQGTHEFHLSGPEALTPAARTEILARALGRPLRWRGRTLAEERQRLVEQGWGEPGLGYLLAGSAEPPVSAHRVTGSVERTLGRAPRDFETWAREHVGAFEQG